MIGIQPLVVNILVYILVANFLLICVLFVLKFMDVSSRFKDIKKTTWVMFLLIFILGSGLRMFFPSCLTPDGVCWNYVGDASTLLEEGRFHESGYTHGYPLLISLSFVLFGPAYGTVLSLNLLFSCLTILLVFLLSYALFRKDDVSLFSAMVFSLLPVAVSWAKEGPSEITSTFFATLAVLVFVISLDSDKKWLYVLSSVLLAFSIQTRMDNVIFIPLFLSGFLLKKKLSFFSKDMLKKLLIPLLLLGFFLIPVAYVIANAASVLKANPHGHPEIYGEYPDLFSVNYLVPGLARHLSHLSVEGKYPPILFLFLFLSLLFIRRERNLIFPVMWMGIFFLFYGLYWGSHITNLDIWHLLLHPPMVILMGYGIFSAKGFIMDIAEKRTGLKFPVNVKTLASAFVLLLIFSVFFGTGIFAAERGEVCFTEDIISITNDVGGEDCLLIDNSQSDFFFFRPVRAMEVIVHGKNLVTNMSDIGKCGNKTKFYLDVKENCPESIFGKGKPMRKILENDYEMLLVKNITCLELYEIRVR